MNRKLRPIKSAQQIKDEQIRFLLEGIEQDIEEYKKIIETRNKQLADKKKILQGAKHSYEELTKENKQLKQYIANIKYQQQQQQQLQQQQYFRPKKYKKVVYEEETNSEIKQDQEETPELKKIEEQDQQQQQQTNKRKRKIFDYLHNNKNAKKNRN